MYNPLAVENESEVSLFNRALYDDYRKNPEVLRPQPQWPLTELSCRHVGTHDRT
jgi:hypothetical protein